MIIPPEDPNSEFDQERQTHIAGIMARWYESQGLVQPIDDFSWEWHSMFDADIDAAQTQQAPEVKTGDTSGESGEGGEVAAPGGSADFGSDFGGDFGAF